MGNCSFLLPSSISGVTATNPDTVYGALNMIDARVLKPFKTSTTSTTIDVSFSSPAAIQAIALIGHNLSPSTAITLQYNSTSIPFPAAGLVARNSFLVIPAPAAVAAYQLTISASSTIAIGEIVFGELWQPIYNFDNAPAYGEEVVMSVDDINGDLLFSDTSVKTTIDLQFSQAAEADLAGFRRLARLGRFVFMPDISAVVPCFYVHVRDRKIRYNEILAADGARFSVSLPLIGIAGLEI